MAILKMLNLPEPSVATSQTTDTAGATSMDTEHQE